MIFSNACKPHRGNLIKNVNVVPEHGESALELIEYLTRENVVSGAGHTGATADQYNDAVEKGLRIAIHFLNGPTGSSTKPFGHGGAIQAVLRSSDVFAELIMDGYHVDPIYVREVLQRKGLTRVIAITDSMFVTGMDEIETFIVSGVLGRVSPNRQYLEVVGAENAAFRQRTDDGRRVFKCRILADKRHARNLASRSSGNAAPRSAHSSHVDVQSKRGESV